MHLLLRPPSLTAMDDLHVRVSSVLDERGVRPERHAFLGLAEPLAVAVCATHTAVTADLQPDDPAVQLCPLCAVFLTAADFDLGSNGSDWKAL